MTKSNKVFEIAKQQLKEKIYRVRMLINKHYQKGFKAPWGVQYTELSVLIIGTNKELIERLGAIQSALMDLVSKIDKGAIEPFKLITVLDDLNTRDEFLDLLKSALHLNTETIHSELKEEQLASAVLYFFEQTGNSDYAIQYLAPLQTDLRDMIDRLGLEEQDYEQMWEELINPKMFYGDYRTSVVDIVFELLRKKQMLNTIGTKSV